MGLSMSTEPLTPPLNMSMIVNGSEAAQHSYLSILSYLNYAIIHRDSLKYKHILAAFVNSTHLYQSPKDMALFVMSNIYRLKSTREELADMHRFFDPGSVIFEWENGIERAAQATNGTEDDHLEVTSYLTVCNNPNTSSDDLSLIEGATFWTEGVAQSVIGIVGVLMNLFSICILSCDNRLKSLFNRILACLLIVHSLYICSTIANYIGRMYFPYSLMFAYFLYPLRPLTLHASTLITVLMARQRFLAIRHPVEYRNSNIWNQSLEVGFQIHGIGFHFQCSLCGPPLIGDKGWKAKLRGEDSAQHHTRAICKS